jgi:hypothetical protein
MNDKTRCQDKLWPCIFGPFWRWCYLYVLLKAASRGRRQTNKDLAVLLCTMGKYEGAVPRSNKTKYQGLNENYAWRAEDLPLNLDLLWVAHSTA